MNGELPQGWAETELGSVLKLVNGFAFKPSHWGKKGLPIIRIQNLNNPDAPFNYCDDYDLPERVRVSSGDLLFAWSGTPGTSFGAHIWNGGDAWLNQHIFRIGFDHRLFDKSFLKHAINQNLGRYIAQAHGGAGLAHITKGMFEASALRFAPPPEQRRIVAKLEKLLRQVDACQQRLAKIPALLKRFRQSVLAAACSGRLTADWREQNKESTPSSGELFSQIQKARARQFADEAAAAKSQNRRPSWNKPELLSNPTDNELEALPDIPEEWLYQRLGNLAEIVRGASPRPAGDPRFFGGNIPWITVAELTKDEAVYLDKVGQFVTEEGKERSRLIRTGTLLLTNSGATLGVPKITRITGCINDGSVALVCIPLTSQLYLYYFLKS